MYNKNIFIADDDENFLDIYQIILTGYSSFEDFNIKTFGDGKALFDSFEKEWKNGNKIPLCILDMKMPRMDGLKTAAAVRDIDPEVIIVIVTAFSDISLNTIKDNLKKDIYYITKPFHKEEIYCLVDSLIKGWNKSQELKESEKKYRSIFESFQDIYYRTDIDGTIRLISPSIKSHCGYEPEELIGASIKCLYNEPDQYELLIKELEKSHSIKNYEIKLKHKDGRSIDVSVNKHLILNEDGKPEAIETISRDITERKTAEEDKRKLEMRLRQKQKMEAIGKLAGGIAHDFNNILSAIIGYTYIAMRDAEIPSKVKLSLDEVVRASYRAAELVKQILAFSRQDEQEKRPVQLNFLVKEVIKLLRATIPSTVQIKLSLEENSYNVMADSIQIHQVIMNLCTNASYAMREKGGILEISLNNLDLEKEKHDFDSGKYLKLSIKDTGEGIDPGNIEHIFEPYFTTKEQGEGTGLGLSVVHGIVKNHRGEIKVESKKGEGTTFIIYLPAVSIDAEENISNGITVPGRNERIIFIDDQVDIVNLWKDILTNIGYKVQAFTSGKKALELFKKEPEKIHLIITDQTMPEITGLKLSEEILKIRPLMPIILCTGFSDLIDEEKVKNKGIKLIMKPLKVEKTTKVLKEILQSTYGT